MDVYDDAPERWTKSCDLSRKEVVINRLRLGHSRAVLALIFYFSLREMEYSSKMSCCLLQEDLLATRSYLLDDQQQTFLRHFCDQQILTIKNVVIECSEFTTPKNPESYWRELGKLLGEIGDLRYVIDFLEINLFNKIELFCILF